MEQFVNMLMVALMSMQQNVSPPKTTVLVENWPALTISEHLVESAPSICGSNVTGCAVVNFNERTCDIYIAWREPHKSAVRERELRRCRGQDEPPYRFKAGYSQWLANQPCKVGKEREARQWDVVAAGDDAATGALR